MCDIESGLFQRKTRNFESKYGLSLKPHPYAWEPWIGFLGEDWFNFSFCAFNEDDEEDGDIDDDDYDDDQGPDFEDTSSFFPCEIDDAIQYSFCVVFKF